MIRPATDADRQSVRLLQGLLDAPAPAMLELAFDTAVGTVLVATQAGDEDAQATRDAERGPGAEREDGSAIVGYALVLPGRLDAERSIVYLAELVVAPGVRRQGHGGALVDAVADRYADYDQLRLTARADGDDALEFYRDQGFWTLDELPDYYRDGDGVLLVRDL